MTNVEDAVNLVLVADKQSRTSMLHDIMHRAGVTGVIRRLPPGKSAIRCIRQRGAYQAGPLPDLVLFDFSIADDHTTSILREIAFGDKRSSVPVILMTSPETQTLLDEGEVDDGKAIMFTPTGLASFVRKMEVSNRYRFFKALRTLYEFGPILVRTPQAVLGNDGREQGITA